MNSSCVLAFLGLFVVASVQGLDVDNAKNRPVSKVITLLKDMVSQLEKEAEEDEEVYEAMGCWCTTGDKAKTKAIADAEGQIDALSAAIEEMTAKSSTLNAEIGNLQSEVAKNTDALDKATALREKELAEFNAEEKENLVSITSLKNAVVTLSKHHDAAMLQTESSDGQIHFLKTIALMHQLLGSKSIDQVASEQQKRVLSDFVQTPDEYSLTQGKAPASGEIYGILKQMKESFETNLANAQKEETKAQSDYESLKAAKTEEIKSGQDQVDTKTQQAADTDEKNAQAKADLEDTRESLAADTEYLANLKERCQTVDQEYEERTKTRQMEIQAVSKALSFLSSDEAHELFTRTFNPALVQIQSSAQSERHTQVLKLLKEASQKFNDPRLSALAVRARLDAFTAVKKAISEMVDKLVQEKKDEIKHKDFCIEELNNNERDTEMKNRDKSDLEAKISDLEMTIDTLQKAIEVLKVDIADLGVQLKRAGENREKENTEFQKTVADQRATAKLVTAALKILEGFYDKALVQTAALVHQHHQGEQAPPPGFKSYENNASSGGVTGMMKSIIQDAEAMEEEAKRGEENAQTAYETFVKDTNASTEAKSKESVEKAEAKAKAEEQKVQAETDLESTMGEVEQLYNANADLHKSCDFTLKNFEVRQGARDDEIEALKNALSIFSGASFSAFLQRL